MDPLTIVVIVVVGVAIVVFGRRRSTGPHGWAPPSGESRGSRGRQPLTRVADVVAIPPPPGWPVLPAQPEGLDGSPPPEEYVAVADRQYARTTCPNCGVELNPLPKAKKRCRECGQEIFVRSGPAGKRHLLAATELDGFDGLWAQHHEARAADAAARQEGAEAVWRQLLRDRGLQVGDYELDVVGESYRHAALAGIRAALATSDHTFENRTVAALEREPENRYDRNAIRVVIHGQMVGYLDRYSAEDYQPVLKRSRGPFYVQAILLGGRPDAGVVGPIGVRLEGVPEP
jgi:ssDNA-binding Zn-finger/Zn-ribbon topoisomerase 1